MKRIAKLLGFELSVYETNYFDYHIQIKRGKKSISGASTKHDGLKKFITESVNKLIKRKILSNVISNYLFEKFEKYYKEHIAACRKVV
jgi:hypothetical protein